MNTLANISSEQHRAPLSDFPEIETNPSFCVYNNQDYASMTWEQFKAATQPEYDAWLAGLSEKDRKQYIVRCPFTFKVPLIKVGQKHNTTVTSKVTNTAVQNNYVDIREDTGGKGRAIRLTTPVTFFSRGFGHTKTDQGLLLSHPIRYDRKNPEHRIFMGVIYNMAHQISNDPILKTHFPGQSVKLIVTQLLKLFRPQKNQDSEVLETSRYITSYFSPSDYLDPATGVRDLSKFMIYRLVNGVPKWEEITWDQIKDASVSYAAQIDIVFSKIHRGSTFNLPCRFRNVNIIYIESRGSGSGEETRKNIETNIAVSSLERLKEEAQTDYLELLNQQSTTPAETMDKSTMLSNLGIPIHNQKKPPSTPAPMPPPMPSSSLAPSPEQYAASYTIGLQPPTQLFAPPIYSNTVDPNASRS